MTAWTFHEAFEHTVGLEGRYSNDPADSGGETAWGITERVARAYDYWGAMASMPLETAKAIYRERYWDLMRLDEVAKLFPDVAKELFDTGVNQGQAVAIRYLQRTLNVLNGGGDLWPDVTVDGLMGRMTLGALQSLRNMRGMEGLKVLLRALNALQGASYIQLAEAREKDERFVYGWLKNRVA